MGERYDVAIVGAGPNGLTAAAYLARAGARVTVLERRFERGGTFATDDYSTPFQYNIAQFALPYGEELPPYRELDLQGQGVRFVKPALPFSVIRAADEPELLVGRGGRGLGAEVERMLAAASAALTPLLYRAPGSEHELRAALARDGGDDVLALAGATPSTLAEGSADVRAAIALRYACGLAGFAHGDRPLGLMGALALARTFEPAIVVGGTKNLANALARVAVGAGARALVSSPVTRVEGASDGLRLSIGDGRTVWARAVLSTLDPRSTFGELAAEELVPDELAERVADWELDSAGWFTAHYGIKGDPPAQASDDAGDALIRVFGFSGPDDVARAFDAAGAGKLPPAPAGHMSAVSAHDPLQASPGPYGPLHTLRLQVPAPYRHPDGHWDRRRIAHRASCWEALVGAFPSLAGANLLFQFCDTPLDIERRFGTTRRGSLRQGALVPAQTLDARPHPSCSGGRTPIPGLYLGGGGVHPGIPGSLAGGHNAAAVIAEDLGLPVQ